MKGLLLLATFVFNAVASTDTIEFATLTLNNEEKSTEHYTEEDYWFFAQKAAERSGWDPYLILSQWQLESGYFKSNNFLKNNNIAGQTWHKGLPVEMKGTARKEGGYYIKYKNPVDGYIEFILSNKRYQHIRSIPTAEKQAVAIQEAGWASDPYYADKLIIMIQKNRNKFKQLVYNN